MSDQPKTPSTTTTHTAWRIEARRPGGRWRFLSFTGATNSDEIAVRKTLAHVREESPLYEYRLMCQAVTVTASGWECADHA